MNIQDLLTAATGDTAARIRLASAGQGYKAQLEDAAAKLGGKLGPFSNILNAMAGAADEKQSADTRAAAGKAVAPLIDQAKAGAVYFAVGIFSLVILAYLYFKRRPKK